MKYEIKEAVVEIVIPAIVWLTSIISLWTIIINLSS
jgi:hypothetical protein